MGCGASVASEEDQIKVVVFGALGMVGGAVAKALVRSPKLKVIAVTRTPTADNAQELAEKGAVIATADLNDPRSLERVTEGAEVVFLTTHYWEHLNLDKEVTQGMNAIDAALKCNIRHFILYGSATPESETLEKSGHFEAKAKIEEYLKSKDIPYTVLRMPFFYENLLTIFRPHKLTDNKYALTLPLEDDCLDCMSVTDMGRCVLTVVLKPKLYVGQTVHLAVERLTVQNMADCLTKHMDHAVFTCPTIRVEDYAEFKFTGARDLAAMFQYYRVMNTVGDVKMTKRMCGSALSFDRWVHDNKVKIEKVMNDEIEPEL